MLARKTAVYQYEFADSDAPRPAGFPVPRTFPLGAYHGAELSYLFDGLGAAIDTRPSSGQRRLADQMIGYWTNFAATGNPNGPGLPRWKPLTSNSANDVHTPGDVAAQHHCRYWATHS
ncbi:carboxylesterase family protein [Nonomuraea sp. NPDC003709]|uniref:carboxylesterase family protein n=1 Tax=Nonomuraea sp. NPDC003709 TaxID=3154450 RepID=UPI00339DF863